MEHDASALGRALPDYEIGRELGRGQYGVVWEARHRHLRRRVAIKQLVDLSGTDTDDARARFRREARILAGLDHPHVVTVYDYREDGDLRLIVIEHLDGGSLGDRRRVGMDGPAQLASMVAAATGLHHVHLSGVLHRDVKPENMLFDGRQALKVTDFGVARGDGLSYGTVTATGVGLSQVGQFFGTPAYVSPEQAETALTGADVAIGPAADEYGLAAVYFEMLTGELTHDAEGGFLGICNRRMNDPAPRARDLAPDVHPAIDEVVATALARRPEDRFADLEQLAVALVRAGNVAYGVGWLDRAQIDLRDTGPAWREAQAGTPPPPSTAAPTPPATPHPAAGRAGDTVVIGTPPPREAAPAAPPAVDPESPDATVGGATPPPPLPAPLPDRVSRRLRLTLAVAAAALVLVVVGLAVVVLTGGDGSDVADSTTTTAPSEGTVATMRQRWSAPTGGNVFSSPTVDGDRIVVGSDDGTVYALAAATGDEIWKVPTGGPVRSTAALADGLYVVGSFDRTVYALAREDGEVVWERELPIATVSTPAVVEDKVLVTADKVYALSVSDGSVLWDHPGPEGSVFVASPVVDGTTVVAASTDGDEDDDIAADGAVVGLDLATGEERWTADAPSGAVVASPRVADGTVVIGDGAGVLWSIAVANGSVERNIDLGAPIHSSAALVDGVAYVGTGDGVVVAVGPDGEVWRRALPGRVDSSPVVVDDVVVVGSNDGRVYALSVTDGTVVSSFRTGGPVLSSPAALDDGVVVGSFDDAVHALDDLHG